MSRLCLVKIMLVTSHRDVYPLSRQDDYSWLNLEILSIFTKKCDNNAFENSDTFDGWFCDFLF